MASWARNPTIYPMDETCNVLASYQCGVCGKWLCAIHAENEMWHLCILEPGDEVGEG